MSQNTSLTLTNLTLTASSVNADGGCLYTIGTLVLNNVEMRQCQVATGFHGGALFVDWAGRATLLNSRVHDNSAGWAGGGVYSLGALTLTNTYVAHNSVATTDGGGL